MRRELLSALLGCVVAATAAGSRPAARVAQAAPTLDEVVERATAYVAVYVDEISTLVMEEDYRQSFFSDGRSNPSRLRLVSEFLLVQSQDALAWVGFRDVFEVNGQRVQDRQDRLASLLLQNAPGAFDQARRIAEESARYNLGSTGRTFNVPTYALFYLHPENVDRFNFDLEEQGCGGRGDAWHVRFTEVARPTLTRGFQGIDLPSRGRFCIEPATGRIVETELELRHPGMAGRPATEANATVTFGPAPALDLWVPLEMQEHYAEAGGRRTNSTATYRDFRRFSVSVSENTDAPADVTDPR